MSHSHSNGGFPLRTDFFRSLPLVKFKNDKIYRLAKANALACLNQSFNAQWRYVPPEKDGTQIRKDTSNLSASYRLVRAATVLRCQEHEVNQVIANTNSESWREFMRKCFGKYYVDTLILHNVINPNDGDTSASLTSTNSSMDAGRSNQDESHRTARSASQPEGIGSGEGAGFNASEHNDDTCRESLWQNGNDPFQRRNSNASSVDTISGKLASECSSANTEERLKEEAAQANDGLGVQAEELLTVKWAAFETGVSGRRDICLMDYLSLAYVPNSEPRQRVHVWCFTSADGDRVGCMELKDTHHVTRTTLTKLGVFWRKVSEDETEVIVCGSFPSKHAAMMSTILLGCLNRLQGIVEDLRMSSQLYIQRATWVKNTDRTTCNLCTRNFHALRRKHHCRRCGEVVCSDCSTVETVDLPAIGYSKLRLCKVCSIRARTTPLKQVAKTNVFDHLVRARSLSNVGSSSTASIVRSSYTDNQTSTHDEGSVSESFTGSTDRYQSQQNSHANSGPNSEVSMPASRRSFQEFDSTNQSSDTEEAPIDITDVAAVVHPMSACLDGPTDDYDDFIDERCLKTQLRAMEQKKRSAGGKSNMFDLLCELACQTLNCPIASVAIEDNNGKYIRSSTGLDGDSPLGSELAIFINKIMGSTPAIVLDATIDKQTLQFFSRRSPPAIRFFAGCPIYSRTGKKLGYICVADYDKRNTLGANCAFTMERLATLAVTTMERNVGAKNENGNNIQEADFTKNCNIQEADFTKRAPPPTPTHPAMLFDRPNGGSSSDRHGDAPRHYPEAMVGRVYEILEDEEIPTMSSPKTVNLNTTSSNGRSGARPAGYYETQERMRHLLLKSYHTQQQLAKEKEGSP